MLAAALLSYAARISPACLMGAALFGFLIRLGLIFLAVLAGQGRLRGSSWCRSASRIIVTHLGLLFWEMKYVSAVPRLPGAQARAVRAAVQGVDRRT